MRKMAVIVMVLLLLLTFVACNSDEIPKNESTQPTQPTQEMDKPVPGVADLENAVENPYNNSSEETIEPTTEKEEPSTEEQKDPSTGTTTPTEKEEDPSENTEPPTTEDETNIGAAVNATAYENYQNMSGEEQKAFMDSFESVEAFFAWLNAARAEYEALNPPIDVGDGTVDLGGGNG